jgi:hypothetical protein
MKFETSTVKITLVAALLLSLVICLFPPSAKAQEEVATVLIVNPLKGPGADDSNKFVLDSSTAHVNDTITVDFYIKDVKNLVGWQVVATWNTSVIQYQTAWVPENNIFKPAIDEGATLVRIKPALYEDYFPSKPDIDALKYAGILLPKTPVDVSGYGLLFEMNFTIAAVPEEGQIFSNIELIEKLDPLNLSLDTYVLIQGTAQPLKVFAEPAIVRIGAVEIIRDIAITSLIADPVTVESGDVTHLEMNLTNFGNDLETFNVTITRDGIFVDEFRQVLGAFQSVSYDYVWNSTGFSLNTPTTSAFFGIPVVLRYEGRAVFSVDLTILSGETNTTNNRDTVTVNVLGKLIGLDYWRWFILVFLTSPLGHLIVLYVIVFVGFLAALSAYRRLRFPKLKPR